MDYDIFLSYRRADQELARELVTALEARGVGVWWDQKIEAGCDWRDAIVENLISSDMLVILFSEECNSSKQLKKELALADDMNKDVIPVLIEDTKPKGHFLYEMAARNWVQIFPDAESKINELADRLTTLAKASSGGLAGTPVETTTVETAPVENAPPAEANIQAAIPNPILSQPAPQIDPNDLVARREALKREEALLKIAEQKAQKAAKPKKLQKEQKTPTKYRNFLPFKWYDFIVVLPIAFIILETEGGGIDRVDLFDIGDVTELVAIIATGLAGLGALLFPIRYFMRNLRMKEAIKAYAKSSFALYAVLCAAGLTYAFFDGGLDEVFEIFLVFGGVWLGFGAGAFALYGLMHFQRTIRSFNSNVDKI